MKATLFFSVIFFSCNINAATLSTALTLNGLHWAQLSDTSYLYVPDVYDACGNNGDTCNGVVEGKDLTGWRWASQSEVNTLVNDLLGFDVHEPYSTTPDTSLWFEYFNITGREPGFDYNIGISADFVTFSETDGVIISDLFGSLMIGFDNNYGLGHISEYNPFQATYNPWGWDMDPPEPYGFFMVKGDYAAPITSEVPLPASLFLFAPALLGFIGLRKKLS